MRKQIALWIASALLCALAGCGGGGSAPPAANDTMPDGLQFAPVANATRDGWIVSERITITGITTQVPISIENGEYAIGSGAFTTAAGTVSAGQAVTVRVRSSATYSKVTVARLTVGAGSTVFEVTAELPDYSPDNVTYDGQDVLYLLSNTHSLVFRWSVSEQRYLDALAFTRAGNAAPKIAVSHTQHRLYLGYSTGAIRYVDTVATNQNEIPFATTAMGIGGLVSVGNYLLAQDDSGAWGTHYVFDNAGTITDQEDWNYYSREFAWDSTTSRVYFFRDSFGPNDLHYEVIDQTSGQITAEGETPYHGDYNIQPPIRVSSGGQYVLLGSGDIYRQSDLQWSGSVGAQIADARWFADGSLVTLRTQGNQTTLRRLSAPSLRTIEQVTYTGQALRIVGTDARMTVAVIDNGTVHLHDYVPNNDSDGDGVANTLDAFPLDGAASVDSDRDGYPDAWNTGRSQSDSTTGLSLDAFPQDSACYLVSHGSGGACNYAATVPNYVPDQVVQQGDTVYLLSSANRRVYRWSIASATYLNPYVVGINEGFSTLAPSKIAYSNAHQRLYLGYSSGAIQYIDVTSSGGAEVPFANTAMGVGGLLAAGNYVLAQDSSGAWARHYVIDSNGAIRAQPDWNYYSREYAWDPVNSRAYFFRDSMSPNDLHFEVIDQNTGLVSAAGETPYHGSYNIQPPIRVSVGGQYVLLGSGDIYRQNGLIWNGSLGMQIADARWFANDSLVTLSSGNNQTVLRRLGGNLVTQEQLNYTGQALRVVGSDARMAVLVINNGTVQFHIYVPNNDSDNDGVPNAADAFPLDPAASVDTDRDGYPDAWNAGRSQSDSTTGLSLDAFPQDSACYLVSHGSGGVCNYGATIPNYVPNQVFSQGDTIYLLSTANRRVYRWSMATGTYMNPYVVGLDQGFSVLAPTKMAYSNAHQRLYLGYSTGAIRYIDVTSNNGVEVPFANVAMSVDGLASVGNYVLAQDSSGAWATHYVIDSSGVITDQADWNRYSREYAWDPVRSRVYFFRDDTSPNDLHYEVINQSTGEIASAGESPYHGDYGVAPPIRVSADGQTILLGTGNVFDATGLTWTGALGTSLTDAQWQGNVLVDLDTTDRVEIRDADSRALLTSYQYLGTPLRLAFGQTEAYLVHVMNGTTAFLRLPFYDQDNDTLPRWWEQLHGLSDANAADALGDLDGDGVSNADEFAHGSNPSLIDTDGDGLTDQQEIVTYSTNPTRADSDGDGLNDYDEVVTHQSDPWDTDSDDDGYTDLDEVLYGGDPNDSSVLPQPLNNYSQSFESNPTLAAWAAAPHSAANWTITTTAARTGTASLRSGPIGDSQRSGIRFRALTTAGQLRFYARVDAESYGDQLQVYVDGIQALSIYANNQWTQYSVPLTLGAHDIEWRYQKNSYGTSGADAAFIDDVTFLP